MPRWLNARRAAGFEACKSLDEFRAHHREYPQTPQDGGFYPQAVPPPALQQRRRSPASKGESGRNVMRGGRA